MVSLNSSVTGRGGKIGGGATVLSLGLLCFKGLCFFILRSIFCSLVSFENALADTVFSLQKQTVEAQEQKYKDCN
jgi:hypothetical protein